MQNIPLWRVAATVGGTALTGSAVWLNAEHVAVVEGWHSPLVVAGVIVTICAACTPPLAERAGKSGQWGKAIVLWTFFAFAVAFSLSASIGRSSADSDEVAHRFRFEAAHFSDFIPPIIPRRSHPGHGLAGG
jgi:hypothetical protein